MRIGPARAVAARWVMEHGGDPGFTGELSPAFRSVVADLGITGTGDILRRADEVARFLPLLWQTAEAILAANPGIDRAPAPG